MNIVGSIKFTSGPAAGREANLVQPSGWTSDDELLAAHLNLFYNPADVGISVMPWGYMAIDLAAKEMGAKATHTIPLNPLPDDVVS